MSIPYSILSSNDSKIISNTTIQYYQNFAKSIMKNKKQYLKKNNKDNPFSNSEGKITIISDEYSKKIFEWFSELPLNTKIQLCSINNKWLSRIINQLIHLYNPNLIKSNNQNSIKLIPIYDLKEFFVSSNQNNNTNEQKNINLNELSYKTYFKINYEKDNNGKYDNLVIINLINNIKFFSFEEGNDTISLNKSFLENPGKIKEIFESISVRNFLKSWIKIYYNEQYKMYNFTFPDWLKKKESFTLFEFMIGYIEQNIILNYEYYLYTNRIYENKLGDKILEIHDLNLKLEIFLNAEYKNSLFENIDFEKIGKCIYQNENINKNILNQTNENCNENNYIVNLQKIKKLLNDAQEKMNEYYSISLSCFLYNIIFLNIEDVCNNFCSIYYLVYKYIQDLFQNKNINELIEEEINENHQKKKRNKKKKNKNKKNKDYNIKTINKKEEEIKNESNFTNNNNIKLLKPDEIKENINEKNNNEKDEINNNKKKQKKKEKFFLFPTQNKKKKNEQIEKKSNNENNQDNENKDKKINDESIKENNDISTENISCQTETLYKDNLLLNHNNIYQNSNYIFLDNNQILIPYPYTYYTSQIITFNFLKNICMYIPSEKFFSDLTIELQDYNLNVNNNNSKLNPIRNVYLNKLSKILKNNLSSIYEIDIIKYGSFITNLSIEGSDIDILIKYKPIENDKTFVSDLISILYKNQYEFDYIKPITTASVPVIKIQFDISSLIELNNIPNYLDEEDLNKLKFDITFKKDDFYSGNYIKTINFVTESINNFPYLKNIVLFLKRYFKKINLNKSYNGGLSSYSLFLLVLAFLKNNKFSNDISIGKQLYYFIEFYSFFNFSEYMIKVSEQNPFVQIEDIFKNDKIIIIDPINQLNVAKSSFKNEEIKNAFIKALNIIKVDAWKIEQQQEFETNSNSLKILYSIFDIK